MNKKEQIALLREILDFLEEKANDLYLRQLRSDVASYSDFNTKIARAFGLDMGDAFGRPCIVVDRNAFESSNPAPTGSWDGIGDYTQNDHHIRKHLLPDDLTIVMMRTKVTLTPEGPMTVAFGMNPPDSMMGGGAQLISGKDGDEIISTAGVSLPRALLEAAILWKLGTLGYKREEPLL